MVLTVTGLVIGCDSDDGPKVTAPAPAAPPDTTMAPTPAPTPPPVSPTTGRNLELTGCSDQILFSNAGTVVLPSVDVVQVPSRSGTLTMDWDSYQVPDRFVMKADGSIAIDSTYVGDPSEYTMAEVNAALTAAGVPTSTQTRVSSMTPGSQSFQKAASTTYVVVEVYAPLAGTSWEVRLVWACS